MTNYLTTPKGNVTIRTATVDDAPPLLALRLEALTKHPEAFAADIDKTAVGGENAWVERITENTSTESGSIIIAVRYRADRYDWYCAGTLAEDTAQWHALGSLCQPELARE